MYWTPCAVVSCPLSGIGFRCFAFRSATTAPAMLSFAASTPWMLLFVFTSIWLKMVRVVRVPVGHELLRALLQRAALEERVEDGVVAALEPERVLVGLAAPQLGDGAALVGAVRLHRGD